MDVAFNILSFLDDYEIPYKTSGKNVSRGWVEISCPFCDDPSTHLGINLDSKLFHCWICSSKGGPAKLIRALTKCTWEQAKNTVEKYTDWSLVELLDSDLAPKKLKLPPEFTPITPNTIPKLVSNYLLDRNFSPEELVRRFNLFYPGPIGDYKLRLIIPVTYRNRIVNFCGRDVTGKTSTRYNNCPNDKAEIPLNSLLYGIEEILDNEPIVLVEGIFDQWRLGYGSVATFGTKVTSEQAAILQSKKPSKIFVLLDPGTPDLTYERIASKLWFSEVEAIYLSSKGDPADLTPFEAQNLMRELRNDFVEATAAN